MKFEFGDLYRFVVSLGVVLITISIMAPWLFLKEPFDLFRSEAELTAMTEIAREAIKTRQSTVGLIIKLTPWLSGFGIVCGAILMGLGLRSWKSNQRLLDEQTRIDVELKKLSLRDATKDEIAVDVARDLTDYTLQEPSNDDYRLRAFEASYSKMEFQVASRLREVYATKYEVEVNKMIADAELDILLRSRSMRSKDVIVEVKLIRRGFNYPWLREAFLKNIYAKTIYAQLTSRLPDSLLLIILDLADETPQKFDELVSRIGREKLGRLGRDRVVLMTKADLMTLSGDAIQDCLGIYA